MRGTSNPSSCRWLQRAALSLALGAGSPARSDPGSPCAALAAQFRESEAKDLWPSQYAGLREQLRNRGAFAAAHAVPAEFVTGMRGKIADDSGEGGWGVAVVDTAEGLMVLKISRYAWDQRPSAYSTWRDMRTIDEALIQDVLGKLGLGLPLKGILNHESLMAVMEKHPELRTVHDARPSGGRPEWAYLVPYLPDAYNPKLPQRDHEIRPLPEAAKTWNWDEIDAWYARTQRALDFLGIRAYDLDVLFTSDGRPTLFDTGFYYVWNINHETAPAGQFGEPADSFNKAAFHMQLDLLHLARDRLMGKQ